MSSVRGALSRGVILAVILLSSACAGDVTVDAGAPGGSFGVETLPALTPSATPPPEEAMPADLDAAYQVAHDLAYANADKLGPPFVDGGDLVITATEEQWFDIARAAFDDGQAPGVTVRYQIVARSSADIARIRKEIPELTEEDVPEADNFTSVSSDAENNRLIIETTGYTTETLQALGRKFGAGAVAIRIDAVKGRPRLL